MKRPLPSERRPVASPGPQSVDETMIDMSRPAGPGSVGQQAGRSTLQVAVATDVGRVRRNNEDYVQAERVVRDGRRYSMWAVADGVGGGPQGELASKTAVETIVDYLAHEPWTDPSVALTEAFALANRNVFEITGEGSAASTMVAALASEPEGVVCIANVGDSRAYIVAGGEARQITDDHSVVAARVAAGQITAAEARTAPDRNVLTRSIGSETETLVDIFGPRQLQPNERLVLCTDGVHGMIDDDAIARLGGGLPIAESAGALVAAAVEAGGKDNATALVGGFAAQGASGGAVRTAGGASPTLGANRRPPNLAVLAAAGLVLAIVLATVALLNSGSPSAGQSTFPSVPLTRNGSQVAIISTSPVTSTKATTSSLPLASPTLATSAFISTGSMTEARSGATATLLSNGKVLILGGSQDASAELYDPSTGKFTDTGSMTEARNSATATRLQDDSVLIAGGSQDTIAELYDPTSGKFSPTIGSMIKGRIGATATLISDGTVLIAGGGDRSAELYDPKTGQFSPTGLMETARIGATATLLSDGTVLIAGGSNGSKSLGSAEIYDPTKETFTATGSMPTARGGAAATVLSGGSVLIVGGSDSKGVALASVVIYDPAKDRFFASAAMVIARDHATLALLSDGRVLVVGGLGGTSKPVASAELYAP
jgi:serine/threonine protein phosphatase PrpC/WD40 repeat protein